MRAAKAAITTRGNFFLRRYKTRADYCSASLSDNDLRLLSERASDRADRADTTENYLIDAYAVQEIAEALKMRADPNYHNQTIARGAK